MKYRVTGIMKFNVSMIVDASSEHNAECKAMDRMDEGALDGFKVGVSVNDNEIESVTEFIEEPTPLIEETFPDLDSSCGE